MAVFKIINTIWLTRLINDCARRLILLQWVVFENSRSQFISWKFSCRFSRTFGCEKRLKRLWTKSGPQAWRNPANCNASSDWSTQKQQPISARVSNIYRSIFVVHAIFRLELTLSGRSFFSSRNNWMFFGL